MEDSENLEFLFDLLKQIKGFYESSVIYVTCKDYSSLIFKTLCTFHEALQKEDKAPYADLILEFHLLWLNMVKEIEDFQKSIEISFPREKMDVLINYTKETYRNSYKQFYIYLDSYKHLLDADCESNLQSELELIEEMQKDVILALEERQKLIKDCKTELEYRVKVNTAAEELLLWVDKLTDGLAMMLSKYLPVKGPSIVNDLTKTLQNIILDIKKDTQSEAHVKVMESLKRKGSDIGSLIRSTTGHALESSKIFNKMNILDERIKRLEKCDKNKPPSAALLALRHKREYLQNRFNSIECLKTTLKSLQKITSVSVEDVAEDEQCICEDFYFLRIFNHILPPDIRERLVTELCGVWDVAMFGARSERSIISILSAAEAKEEFTDELGTFYVDEYSRRIYKLPDDENLYQPNEHNELVRVSDDQDHVYFYDDCGRYFVDVNTKQRVYKAHSKASEYMMDSSGVLLKVKEVRDDVTYYYDNYGRYYIDKDGKHIYQDPDSISKYENDGLGNLVRIRSHLDIFDPCPGDVNVTEDFKYLKETVGQALKECISRVLVQQPSDPIKYLSACLVKYRENLEIKERRLREQEELDVEREIAIAEERAAAERAAMEAALLNQGASEASYDSNLLKYTPLKADEVADM